MLLLNNIIKTLLDIPSLKIKKKYIIILSDDWGSIRIKSYDDQQILIKKGLSINNRFDKYDSLETNSDIEYLFEILTKYKDNCGNHPVVTAVTNVANPDFIEIKKSNFLHYHYETIDKTYKRYKDSDRVLNLINEGIRLKIFIPQFHGREHLQINWWINELKIKDSAARKFFENEFFFVPATNLVNSYRNRGLAASFDIWDNTDLITQKEIINSGLKIFKQLFGYNSLIFSPPALYYSPMIEDTLFNYGIRWLDVSRVFIAPGVRSLGKLQINYLGKKKKSGLRVLIRNSIFEPYITDLDDGVNRCLKGIESSFKRNLPAIISNHRVAFVSRIDPLNRFRGLKALDSLLSRILKKWPDVEFISAVDFVNKLK
ncbi:MAG: hypothetical protein ACK4EX_08850 [Thermaurantimonas sp.]|uniref:hypothetical protein n=1 Tax=Thermaurantimonas sp. TaxID=2681568 RepID=UPI00391BE598